MDRLVLDIINGHSVLRIISVKISVFLVFFKFTR
jgi:hypothetical protein